MKVYVVVYHKFSECKFKVAAVFASYEQAQKWINTLSDPGFSIEDFEVDAELASEESA